MQIDSNTHCLPAYQTASGASAMPVAAAKRIARRPGETAAADMHTPAATRNDLFGAVDSSTFEGLGLATSLADHLEGLFCII